MRFADLPRAAGDMLERAMSEPVREERDDGVGTALLAIALAFVVFLVTQVVGVLVGGAAWPWGALAVVLVGFGGGWLLFLKSPRPLVRGAAFGVVLGTIFALMIVVLFVGSSG